MRLCLLTGGAINLSDEVQAVFGRAAWFEDGE